MEALEKEELKDKLAEDRYAYKLLTELAEFKYDQYLYDDRLVELLQRLKKEASNSSRINYEEHNQTDSYIGNLLIKPEKTNTYCEYEYVLKGRL